MLKKIIYICLVLMMLSCERIFINGDLDGMWRLECVESEAFVVYPEDVFYSFQRHLVMMGIYSETEHPKNYYMGCFVYENDSIIMDNFYRYPGMDGICVSEELTNLYIYDTTAKFEVVKINKDVLVLFSSGTKYTFKKW